MSDERGRMTEEELYEYWILKDRPSMTVLYHSLCIDGKPYGTMSTNRANTLVKKFKQNEGLCPCCKRTYRPVPESETNKYKKNLENMKMLRELKK